MYHERFEKAFADYLGVRYSISLPSCTLAIHLSLLALGVGAGDEVIVPDITWIASAAPNTCVGATPSFADNRSQNLVDKKFGLTNDRLMALMGERNVDCRPFFNPLSSLLAYANSAQAQQALERNRVNYQISQYGINLPSGLNMTEEMVKYVYDILKHILQGCAPLRSFSMAR